MRQHGVAAYKVMTRWNAPHQGRETAVFKVRDIDTLVVNAQVRVDGGEPVKYKLIFKRAQR